VKLEPVRRHTLLSQFDFLQLEIARLLELETDFKDAEKREALRRVYESVSNITSVIKPDLLNLLSSIDGLDLEDERVQLVLGILKSDRLRPNPLGRTVQMRQPRISRRSEPSEFKKGTRPSRGCDT
jgi:hypothetical protein